MMFCINIDHPDAMEFVTYKQRMITDLNLRKWKGSREAAMEIWPWYHANVSACLTSSFHKALQDGTTAPILDHTGKKVGEYDPDERLRELAYYAWASGDPGIINLHAVNQLNNTAYFETIESTNPCGEIPLPPYGVCFLGSVNLAIVDEISQEMADTIVRFMDNVVSLNYYPYDACRQRGMISRRIGIGFMGLAERLVKDNIVYGSPESIEYVKALYMDLRDKLYTASVKLSKERGPFPAFARAYLERPFIQRLPAEIRKDIARYGIRNACLMTQAPTGTTSALAGTSSGIEPYFAAYEIRTDGTGTYQVVHPYAGHPAFITASEITPEQHVLIQAAAQEFIDQAISKTINLPENATVDDVYAVYRMAIRENLKGITVYRDNCTGLQVIQKPRCPECGHGTIINAGCQECPHCGWSVCAN
jgi:ribonucleoside-diphosphate reductase alpha chain